MMYIEEIKTDECRETLKNSHLGRIACSSNNQPYVVPFYFTFDGRDHLYAFSTVGKKILWMRKNPQVCVEIDEIKGLDNWSTLIIFGLYEELSDKPEFANLRNYAHELLSSRPMWWKPAYVAGTHREITEEKPVYFRIFIEKITGHRAVSDDEINSLPTAPPTKVHKSWFRSLWLP